MHARTASMPSARSALVTWIGTPTQWRLDLGDAAGDVLAEVGLVEDHRRLRAARPDAGEVALDPADVEVGVEAADGEHQVDVGRDHLRARLATGGAAGEDRAPRRGRVR